MRIGRTLMERKKIAQNVTIIFDNFLAIFTAEKLMGSKSKIEREEQGRKRDKKIALANFLKVKLTARFSIRE